MKSKGIRCNTKLKPFENLPFCKTGGIYRKNRARMGYVQNVRQLAVVSLKSYIMYITLADYRVASRLQMENTTRYEENGCR